MAFGAWTGLVVQVSAVGVVPGVAAAVPLEPSAIADLSAPIRALLGSGLVLVFGAILLTATNTLIDRSVEASLKSVPRSVFYGLTVHFVIVFAGVYIISQIARLVGGTNIVVFALVGIGLMIAAGLGFTVLGSVITEFIGERRPWLGLGIGAAIAAALLLLLPFMIGIGGWVFLVSIGIGGSAREWFHATHTSVDQNDGPA